MARTIPRPALRRLAPTVELLYTARLAAPLGHAIEIRVTASDLVGNQRQVSRPA